MLNAAMIDVIRPLGFEPFVHYVPYAAENLDALAGSVLAPSNRTAINAIRRQGQQLIHARHTSTHRAAEINMLAVNLGL